MSEVVDRNKDGRVSKQEMFEMFKGVIGGLRDKEVLA